MNLGPGGEGRRGPPWRSWVAASGAATCLVLCVLGAGPAGAASVGSKGNGYSLFFNSSWLNFPRGTEVRFQYTGGNCTDQEFNGVITVDANPYQKFFEIFVAKTKGSCAIEPSTAEFDVTMKPPHGEARRGILSVHQVGPGTYNLTGLGMNDGWSCFGPPRPLSYSITGVCTWHDKG